VTSKATDSPQGLGPIVVDLIGGFKVNAGYVICPSVTTDPTVVFGDSSDREGGFRFPQEALEVQWTGSDLADAAYSVFVDNIESLLMLVDAEAVFLEMS
jgi:hypothetical protein